MMRIDVNRPTTGADCLEEGTAIAEAGPADKARREAPATDRAPDEPDAGDAFEVTGGGRDKERFGFHDADKVHAGRKAAGGDQDGVTTGRDADAALAAKGVQRHTVDTAVSSDGAQQAQKTSQAGGSGDGLPAATPAAKARQLARQYGLNQAQQAQLTRALKHINAVDWNRVGPQLVKLAKAGHLGFVDSIPDSQGNVMRAAIAVAVNNPRHLAQLARVVSHPQFSQLDEKTKLGLIGAAGLGRGAAAIKLLESQHFQRASAADRAMAAKLLSLSQTFASQPTQDLEELRRKAEELKKAIRNAQKGSSHPAIQIQGLSAALEYRLKENPELFHYLSPREKVIAAHALLNTLGDSEPGTDTHNTIKRVLTELKADNPELYKAVFGKVLAGMRRGADLDSLLTDEAINGIQAAFARALTRRWGSAAGAAGGFAIGLGYGLWTGKGVEGKTAAAMEAMILAAAGALLSGGVAVAAGAAWGAVKWWINYSGNRSTAEKAARYLGALHP